MAEFAKAVKVSEVAIGIGKVLELKGKRIVVFKTGNRFYALDDICVHRGGPLSEGSLEGGIVTCPWHGWQYDAATGKSVDHPGFSVRAYEVKVDGEDVLIAV